MSPMNRRHFVRNAALGGLALSQSHKLLKAQPQVAAEHDPDWDWKLFYERPAPAWPVALPIGNGRLGAMVFGEPMLERIQLNEESIWDGERRNRDNPRAAAAIPEIRKLLFAGKVHEAEALAISDMLSVPRRMPCYQTLGDLHLDFSGGTAKAGSLLPANVKDYRLDLDLDRAIVTTTFMQDSVQYMREAFVSVPDQVIVIRLTASKPGAISFSATLDRPGNHRGEAAGNDTLALSGEALPVNDNPGLPVKERQVGVRFLTHLRAHAEGGSVRTVAASGDRTGKLDVQGANAVTLLIDCATNFRYPEGEQAMAAAVGKNLAGAARHSYSELLARHVASHRQLFRRSSFWIDGAAERAGIPTDVRIRKVKAGEEDLGLLPLYFHYGRYLLISSSRPGTLAANLQGIWNDSVDPPWGCKYTVNINAQMNYWLAERANLSELHEPLFQLLESTNAAGTRVAKSYYGANGSVVHHNTDIWGDAGPIDGLGGGIWAMGGAWMATHLWDRYQYTEDKTFLRDRAYPALRKCAVFLLDYLTPSPDGHLVTGPSCSPENAYKLPDGTHANLCMAPTMDLEITRAIFAQTTEAARILGIDAPLAARMAAAEKRLPQYKIGRAGNLIEWPGDYPETELGHRHISHMWALYPHDAFTLRGTPELAKACRIALERRLAAGSGSTGWSRAWFVNCFARLEDGDQCHKQLTELLRLSTLENLFDVCGIKPTSYYQIDGNLGAAAGMAEMLLQSHGGVIRLLRALPSAWSSGRFMGLRARGNVIIDLAWKDGKATEATLTAKLDGERKIAVPSGQRIASITESQRKIATPTANSDGLYTLKLKRGGVYKLTFA